MDWQAWHDAFDVPESWLARRLRAVQDRIRDALDTAPSGPLRAISLCAGQGRDLTADTLPRATFCYPDSAAEPVDFGVASGMHLIELAEDDDRDALDDYIEAQIHGPVVLDRHVEALVLDPCYRSTPVEEAARRLPCRTEWHTGFRLTVEQLRRHSDYRGAEFVELGAEIAEDGLLDPRIIGGAARSGRHDLQSLKKVWHCLARFGAPLYPTRPHWAQDVGPAGVRGS
ncbi:hypothetical protein GCM10015535_41290 [Streptomyces gelaticus]|uniref:Uncharacterized protein n=1 Tax=Streptomyces gelaticus TaxID=285446 RepID=A0ABQ2W515_9ACTN|nr:DUF3626 domain-containing protein [Streptomyces gelaticus]GGV88906.1 hypothetical protein GCM10015535_41290 [Streptomyces gelaticus]